jgi:CRISPR system Cascade subunit CasE
MRLCLSRIQVNPFSRRAVALAADPGALHATLYGLFDEGMSGRLLFRVDPDTEGLSILVQSETPPHWDRLGLCRQDLRSEPESKELVITPNLGAEFSFRLLARPVRRQSTGKGCKAGPRHDLRDDQERLDWLGRKGLAGGFRITTCGLTLLTFAAVKSERPMRAKGGSFTAVRFDGEIVVTDPNSFEETLTNGIGTQKAFGFGLLSIGHLK